jgi:hypothetical protein
MNITLDTIRQAAEAKYGSTDIELASGEVVKLLNPLRMPKSRRDALRALQDRLGGDDADQEALLGEALGLVAETPGKAKKLVGEIGGDLAVLAEVFGQYTTGTQAGEASPSAA